MAEEVSSNQPYLSLPSLHDQDWTLPTLPQHPAVPVAAALLLLLPAAAAVCSSTASCSLSQPHVLTCLLTGRCHWQTSAAWAASWQRVWRQQRAQAGSRWVEGGTACTQSLRCSSGRQQWQQARILSRDLLGIWQDVLHTLQVSAWLGCIQQPKQGAGCLMCLCSLCSAACTCLS